MNAGFPPTRRNPPAFSAPPDPTGCLHRDLFTQLTQLLRSYVYRYTIIIKLLSHYYIALLLLQNVIDRYSLLKLILLLLPAGNPHHPRRSCARLLARSALLITSLSLSPLHTHTQVIQSEKNKTSFWLFDIRSSSTGVRGTVPVAES